MNIEFPHQVCPVCVDSLGADAKVRGQHGIGQSPRNTLEDLQLPVCQFRDFVRTAHNTYNGRGQNDLAFKDAGDIGAYVRWGV